MTTLLLMPGKGKTQGGNTRHYLEPLDSAELRGILAQAKPRRLVIGYHGDPDGRGEIQLEAVRAGIDPLSIGWLALDSLDKTQTQRATAAAVAQAEAFTTSTPDHLRSRVANTVGRRAFLRGLVLEYDAVPAVEAPLCHARKGCDLCVQACPAGAIKINGKVAAHDAALCLTCGRCITACPTGATTNPVATPEILEAGLRTLIHQGAQGIVFHCRAVVPPELEASWSPMAVPCVGMIPPSWLIAPLLLGAKRSAQLACRAPCATATHPATADAVAMARDVLEAAGLERGLVADEADVPKPAAHPAAAVGVVVEGPFRHDGAPRVFRALADAVGHDFTAAAAAGLANVTVTTDCSLCGACAEACPSSALTLAQGAGVALSFDAQGCVACHRCESVCPEKSAGAIKLTVGIDTAALRAGPVELRRSETLACRSCGRPVAAEALMERVIAILGERPAWASLCMDCRATGGLWVREKAGA